jgi:hypothetical protein
MAEGIKITAKVTNKSKTNKGIQLEGQEGWFSVPDKLVPYAEKINKGDLIEVTYVKKGTFQNVLGLYPKTEEEQVRLDHDHKAHDEPEKKEESKYKCTECGATLKDGKFKKCFNCNKKAKENPKVEEAIKEKEPVKTQVFDDKNKSKEPWNPGQIKYGSEEDIAGKEVGCASNSAAAILAGRSGYPEELLEEWRILFNGILEHIRANK